MKIVPNRIAMFLVVFLLQQTSVFADTPPPPPSPPGPLPPGLPLDGGLFLLVALSITYGIYKLNKIKKASN